MFSSYEEKIRPSITPVPKQIYLIENSYPQKLIIYTMKRTFNKQQVIKLCEKNWWEAGKYRKSIRFFMIDGVELDEDDLHYLKNKARLYVSRGEDFDEQKNFGEYKMVKELGEGGFGKVYHAENIITGESAAVKVLKVEKISGASDIDMIFREIENLKALNHQNIVKILNCYTLKNMQVYVVMEYLEGGELLSLLREKKYIPEQQAKDYFRQIISAVSYCHKQNIIHRDLKVENILFKNEERKVIKIADFGISGMADQFNPDFDAGTLKYMAPEVLSAKEKSNTPAVDVWACGVILYYMLYGMLPFGGSSSSQIISSICSGKFSYPKAPEVSEECRDLINKILEVNPKKRIKMCEIQDEFWLQTKQSRLRKQLSLRLESDYILENEVSSHDQSEILEADSIREDEMALSNGQIREKIKYKNKERALNCGGAGISEESVSIRNSEEVIKSTVFKEVKEPRKSLHLSTDLKKSIQSKNSGREGPPVAGRLEKEKQQVIEELQNYNKRRSGNYGPWKSNSNYPSYKSITPSNGLPPAPRIPKARVVTVESKSIPIDRKLHLQGKEQQCQQPIHRMLNGPSNNYCSQELPAIKDLNALRHIHPYGNINVRLGSGSLNKSRTKRNQELSLHKDQREGRDSREGRIRKKTSLLNWK